ncbi:MAG: T9SS type A sorting domain-containing protein [Candidatus Cloacimonetes bacterium]|nr:T9SS type A sorting domain-containing protein [Candidatus Cloacimonadota bacterium]
MKKLFLFALIFSLAALAFAANLKALTQEVVLGNGVDITTVIVNNSTVHAPGYVVTVQNVTPEHMSAVLSTATNLPNVINLNRTGNGIAVPYWVRVSTNLSNLSVPWFAGDVIRWTVTHTASGQSTTWDYTLLDGTSTGVIIRAPNTQVIPPLAPTNTFQLTVNSIPAGIHEILTGGTAAIGQDTPWTSEALNAATDLVGTYTLAAVPGFHWVPASREVVLDDFVAAKSAVGSRSKIDTSGAKALLSATITFDLVEDEPVYDLPEGGEPSPIAGTVAATIQLIQGNANNNPAGEAPVGFWINPLWNANGNLPPLTLAGAGPWQIRVVGVEGDFINWTHGPDFGSVENDGDVTILVPAFAGKGPFYGGLGEDGTLPVELSSFTATLTAQNFVKLTWVSQSESNLLGYRVLRGDSDTQNDLTLLTPVMVQATNTSTTASYSVTDVEVAIGSMYYYWLESVEMDGSSSFHGPINVLVEGEVPPVLPTATSMSNAYPHPFRMSEGTNIDVNVKAGEAGTVTVYNILGQVVKTFSVKEGSHKLNWNGRDSKNNVCANGIYFYKLSTPSMNQTKKMVIVK